MQLPLGLYRWCSVTEQFSIRWISTSHLSKLTWSWGYYWQSKVCFLTWPWPWHHQRRKLINKALRQIISNNIPTSPVYRVYISQLIRYSRAYNQYSDDLDRALLLTQKLLKLGYVAPMLMSSLQILFSRYHKMVDYYEISMDLLLFT